MEYAYCNFHNYNKFDKIILNICKNEYSDFFKKPNVVGVGLGYKITKGFPTNKKCIKVFVSSKVSSYKLSFNQLIPHYYKGIETDVIESNIFQHQLLTNRVRPVLGGYSISDTTFKNIGSIGCIVKDSLSRYYLLSCNHTIAGENSVILGASIVQPGVCDGGKSPKDLIASLYKFIPLEYTTSEQIKENYVDAAIAIISKPSLVSKDIYLLGPPRGIIPPALDQSVRKVGRTSDVTYGYVIALGTTITIKSKKGVILYKNQIVTTSMSEKGDSGSLLMDLNNNAVGLIIGGSTSDTIASPISTVLNSLGITLVTN